MEESGADIPNQSSTMRAIVPIFSNVTLSYFISSNGAVLAERHSTRRSGRQKEQIQKKHDGKDKSEAAVCKQDETEDSE